jgi:membrane protein implicated in regulation of membrane protease activity
LIAKLWLILSGSQILVAFGIVALVFSVFLAFVFRRLLRIRASRGDDNRCVRTARTDLGDHGKGVTAASLDRA